MVVSIYKIVIYANVRIRWKYISIEQAMISLLCQVGIYLSLSALMVVRQALILVGAETVVACWRQVASWIFNTLTSPLFTVHY